MKLTYCFFALTFLSPELIAQNVGVGTLTPNPNAMLHVDLGLSTSKGFLVAGIYDAASTIPDLGAGSRMIYYPGKAAFRAGNVTGTQWNNINVGLQSTAIGTNSIASGSLSTAVGFSSSASEYASTA
ncbi:MAG TPA: hypothetical protein VK498_13110, partial [Ferruginibacter sp.]|nr:hypothetical protein [Ferruginibacter sp.]